MIQESEKSITEKEKIINDLEFNVIFDKVLSKIPTLSDLTFTKSLYEESLSYVSRVIEHPTPQFYISTIVNELRTNKDEVYCKSNDKKLRKTSILSLLIYVNLYYLKRDQSVYTEKIIPNLVPRMGFYNNSTNWTIKRTQDLLAELPAPSEVRGTSQDDNEPHHTKNQLCIKVLIRMYEKLWSKMQMNNHSNSQKARFLAAISGYSEEAIKDKLSRNFELTERDHSKDVLLANELLLQAGIKKPINIEVKNKS